MSGSCICRCTIMTSAGYYPLGWLQRLPRVIMFRWLSQLGNGAGGQIGTRRSWSGLAGIGATTTALVMRKWQRKRTNQEPLTYGHKPQEWVEWGVLGSGSLRAFCYLLSGKKGVKGTRGETNGRPRGKMQLRCCSQNSSQHQPTHTHTHPQRNRQTWRLLHFAMHAASHFLLDRMTPSCCVLRPAATPPGTLSSAIFHAMLTPTPTPSSSLCQTTKLSMEPWAYCLGFGSGWRPGVGVFVEFSGALGWAC